MFLYIANTSSVFYKKIGTPNSSLKKRECGVPFFNHFWKNSSLCKKNIYGKLITPVYEKISRSYFYDIYKKETNV